MFEFDVYDLLFYFGFSIKDMVDDLVGCGVGLDVVKINLIDIRGVIIIDLIIGRGIIFIICLFLILSILKVLCCISDCFWIVFFMDGVEDMVKVFKDEVKIGLEG